MSVTEHVEGTKQAITFSEEKREWLYALYIAIVVIILLLLPYLLGYARVESGMTFTGILMNPEDTQTYFAKMLQGYDGEWRYRIPFTPEQHEPVFLGGVYVLLGHTARIFNLSLDAIWHLSRIAADLLLFLTTFWFIKAFTPRRNWRLIIYLLALFGSGLGWLLLLLNQPLWLGAFPVDFYQPEARLLFMALLHPHVGLGTALLLISMRLLWRVQRENGEHDRWRTGFIAGFVNLLLVITYPFLIYLVLLTNLLYFGINMWRTRHIRWTIALPLGIAFAIPAPLLLYYAWVLRQNEVFRAWDVQALTASPPWPHYLLAFGPVLAFALLSLRWKSKTEGFGYLWTWLLAAALLVYAPLNPQRRFVQGAQVSLSILAVTGFLGVVVPRLQQTSLFRRLYKHDRYSEGGVARFLTFLFLAFMALSNLYVLGSVSVLAGLQQPYPLFRPVTETAGVQWLRQNTASSAVVLGAYQSGNYIAARAGNPVVLGHWAETMDYATKLAEVEHFFDVQTTDESRQQLLKRYNVRYVWYGPQEQALGNFAPDTVEYLEPLYQQGDIAIYAVSAH